MSEPPVVLTGAERLAHEPGLVPGSRIGLVANQTSVGSDLRPTAVRLLEAGVGLKALFAPEHGVGGTAQAGESEPGGRDEDSGLPVYDTYGSAGGSLERLLAESEIDVLLFDLQDIGTRFYTYIWTMYDLMVAATRAEVDFVVLDRPNPLGGMLVEGPFLDDRFASFVGRAAIPLRHGLTAGELALHLNATTLPHVAGRPARLQVVGMQGWERWRDAKETGLPWVMPSVNIPTTESALVYPGTGLFEGTNASEGRGTTRPFELVGAPYVDARWARELNNANLSGVHFRDVSFRPTFHKHAGEKVRGVQVHVLDRQHFRPVRTALVMLEMLRDLYPDGFGWRMSDGSETTEDAQREEHRYVIDLLWGSDRLRARLDHGEDPTGLLQDAPQDVRGWAVKDALLYE